MPLRETDFFLVVRPLEGVRPWPLKNFFEALKMFNSLSSRNSRNTFEGTYSVLDPHCEGVGHANKPKSEKDVDRLEKVAEELEVERRREEDGAHQLALRCHEPCSKSIFLYIHSNNPKHWFIWHLILSCTFNCIYMKKKNIFEAWIYSRSISYMDILLSMCIVFDEW